MSGYSFNPRYQKPSPDVMRRLELSRQAAENIETRKMFCPVCGFLVSIISVTQTEVVFVRCRKCKFEGVLSPAYFRRIKRLSTYNARLSRRPAGHLNKLAKNKAEDSYGENIYLY